MRRGSRPQLSGFDSQLGMVAIKSPLCQKLSLVVLYKMTRSAFVAAGTKELKKPRLLIFPSAMLRRVTIAFLKSRNPLFNRNGNPIAPNAGHSDIQTHPLE